ncbi:MULTISPECIES: DUF4912 domain-containing protein [unclassified Bacillus (in: firmicutes)]|uniref:DUF4912 domain-containing protein n=1 Tax=unclassified Bacillus (in: firmicutes) TaxID=185979 RepID=UPI0008E95F72|nr:MULTISPECIES: DUF4912 domain-containing protein [unclassified Bacillus (in: firmicutes)]SFA96154.1 hypothetical protein SAMN02799634_103145 [Bacillus sp. UNCCL13]SFQ79627.1 hypothetical protein SAMN04488577_1778 [Bacillus sp. cl95]
MIEEIIFLKNKGLSFRRIAHELDSTVGKVQYQWTKWMSKQSEAAISEDGVLQKESGDSKFGKSSLSIAFKPDKKLRIVWCISEAEKELVTSYFNEDYNDLVHLIRIFDVTGISFSGHNGHKLYELAVPNTHKAWTVKGLQPERDYMAEFGVLLTGNKYFPILRSNQAFALSESGKVYDREETISVNNLPNWHDHVSTYTYYQKYLVEREEGYDEPRKKR